MCKEMYVVPAIRKEIHAVMGWMVILTLLGFNEIHNYQLFDEVVVMQQAVKRQRINVLQKNPDNLNPPELKPCSDSNQIWFPRYFHHTFTAILPLLTRTLCNSNLPLTGSNFHFRTSSIHISPLITPMACWTTSVNTWQTKKNSLLQSKTNYIMSITVSAVFCYIFTQLLYD